MLFCEVKNCLLSYSFAERFVNYFITAIANLMILCFAADVNYFQLAAKLFVPIHTFCS